MKRRIARLSVALAAMLLLLTVLSPLSAAFASADAVDGGVTEGTEAGAIEYWGRYALSTMDNAEALLYAYDAIVRGVEASVKEITVIEDDATLTEQELVAVYDAYRRDRPEHFWLGNSYTYYTNPMTVLSVFPTYLYEGEELATRRQELDARVSEILSSPLPDDPFRLELYLHDLIAESVVYNYGNDVHNLYGALVNGVAVCEGYAEALQYLLQLSGIPCFIMTGSSYNPTTSESEGHAWCAVKLGDSYYQLDPTWNDQPSYTYHAYFNLTDAEISKDHIIDVPDYPLPVCSSTEMNYFTVMGGDLRGRTVTAEDIADGIRNSDGYRASFLVSDTDGFIEFARANITDIAELLGIDGVFSYGFSSIGGEVLIEISACRHTSLTHHPEAPAGCTLPGRSEYYSCECGRLFRDSLALTEIGSLDELRTSALGHSPIDEWQTSESQHYLECSRCSVRIDEGEHIAEIACGGECTVCGYPTPVLHTFDGECDTGCNVCDYTREVTHTFSEEIKHDYLSHFRVCECGERTDEEKHSFDGELRCTVCGYIEPWMDCLPVRGSLGIDLSDPKTLALLAAGVIVILLIIRAFTRKKR